MSVCGLPQSNCATHFALGIPCRRAPTKRFTCQVQCCELSSQFVPLSSMKWRRRCDAEHQTQTPALVWLLVACMDFESRCRDTSSITVFTWSEVNTGSKNIYVRDDYILPVLIRHDCFHVYDNQAQDARAIIILFILNTTSNTQSC